MLDVKVLAMDVMETHIMRLYYGVLRMGVLLKLSVNFACLSPPVAYNVFPANIQCFPRYHTMLLLLSSYVFGCIV